MKLHIGGKQAKEGWRILNALDGPAVDFVGNCVDLSRFPDASVAEIYASHVFEHLGYRDELPTALGECWRVLEDGGTLSISVPNFGVICQLFASGVASEDQQWQLMRIAFGGQTDAYDIHKVGLIEPFLRRFLGDAGFTTIERVAEFGLFDDTSAMRLGGHLISLNMIATK